jgi:nucleoside-diphosphate-sugar epimerase
LSNVLILGANGGIARLAIDLFLKETDVRLTLYLRHSYRLRNMESNRVRVIEGDVLDIEKLKEAMIGQDVVYANLAGDLEQMAKNIVEAMDATGVKRLIFISSMGIYDEVPGEKYGSILDPYRKAAQIIEASGSVNDFV